MGLINYTNLEDGESADSNKFNQRFGDIVNVINGNIDTQNLKNGGVTREKIAPGAVTSDKIATDRYIDANGWTVNDLGGTKTYSYAYAITNVVIQNGARKDDLPPIQPPVGRTRDNIVIMTSWYGVYSGHAIPGVESNGASGIAVTLGNQYVLGGIGVGTLTFNGTIYISATEKL